MAGRTLAAEVIGGFIATMAGDTVRRSGRAVIEGCRQPGAGAVTGRTLSRIMVCRLVSAMAGDTICRPSRIMIKSCRQPGTCVVASRTLPRIMVHWPVLQVAAAAVLCKRTTMIEDNLVPPFNRMAGPAFKTELPIMWFILGMTGSACRIATHARYHATRPGKQTKSPSVPRR